MDRLFEVGILASRTLSVSCLTRSRFLLQSAQDDKEEEDDEPQIGRSRVGAPSDDEDW